VLIAALRPTRQCYNRKPSRNRPGSYTLVSFASRSFTGASVSRCERARRATRSRHIASDSLVSERPAGLARLSRRARPPRRSRGSHTVKRSKFSQALVRSAGGCRPEARTCPTRYPRGLRTSWVRRAGLRHIPGPTNGSRLGLDALESAVERRAHQRAAWLDFHALAPPRRRRSKQPVFDEPQRILCCRMPPQELRMTEDAAA